MQAARPNFVTVARNVWIWGEICVLLPYGFLIKYVQVMLKKLSWTWLQQLNNTFHASDFRLLDYTSKYKYEGPQM